MLRWLEDLLVIIMWSAIFVAGVVLVPAIIETILNITRPEHPSFLFSTMFVLALVLECFACLGAGCLALFRE